MRNININISLYLFGTILILSMMGAVYSEQYLLLAIPFAVVGVAAGIFYLDRLYYLLLFFLPLSVEMQLPGGFGTDFPDEILIVGLMIAALLYVLTQRDGALVSLSRNPLFFILTLHFLWFVVSTVVSENVLTSVKYTLAKFWYLTTFIIITVLVIRDRKQVLTAFWVITAALTFVVALTLVRHAGYGFSFVSVNKTMVPFFRNHVNYAAMIAEWLPFVWLAYAWNSKKPITRGFLVIIGVLLLTGLVFSYTRSAWLALAAALAVAVAIRLSLIRWLLTGAAVAAVAGIIYISSQYRYMQFAPEFEETIYHENLEQHLQSTYKIEDVSSAERVYRWVAGFKMWDEKPLTGYGPGNFYNFYKGFTVPAFKTYVSDNPEKSTVHNYFLLILIEQGLIGLVIFLVLTFAIYIYGEKLYHRITDQKDRQWLMAIMMSITAIYVVNLMSDMLETDKVGSIYFINVAMIIILMAKYPSMKTGNHKGDIVVK